MTLTTNKFCDLYWTHYISLEKEFTNTLQYVSLDPDNYNTFSEAYIKLILEIGSEIDIVAKMYCKMLDENFSGERITDYQICICRHINDFYNQTVELTGKELILKPWENWGLTPRISPYWWSVYNKVKHERFSSGIINEIYKEYYKFANLKNTLFALAGLYQCLIYIYYKLAINENDNILVPLPGSRLFKMSNGMWEDIEFYSDYALYIDDNGNLIYRYSNNIFY